jgi:hypothetical protein
MAGTAAIGVCAEFPGPFCGPDRLLASRVLKYRVCAVKSLVVRSVPPGRNGSNIRAGTAAARATSVEGELGSGARG